MKHTMYTHSHPNKTAFLNLARRVSVDERNLQGYILECEHQDGKGFWDHFENGEEIFEDFVRYDRDYKKSLLD